MIYHARKRIKDHTAELEKIYKQRQRWLLISSIVVTSVILVIFGSSFIDSYNNKHIWWIIVSLGLILSMNWWYWTMKSVSALVRSIYAEYEILNEITSEIEELRVIIKNDFSDQ